MDKIIRFRRRISMFYDAQFSFLKRVLRQYNIDCYFISCSGDCEIPFKADILRFVYNRIYDKNTFKNLKARLQNNVIYQCRDILDCQYYMLRLPDTDPEQILLAGPYTDTLFSREHIPPLIERIGLPSDFIPSIDTFYSSVPLVSDTHLLFALFNTFGETIFHGMDHFSFENITDSSTVDVSDMLNIFPPTEQENISFKMKQLETTYHIENQMMTIVSRGLIHQTEFFTKNIDSADYMIEQRVPDSIRNLKNYCIILNTLLRKAAENGSVHPFYIDKISSAYARKIELINSAASGLQLSKEMIRKYCLLVRNYSMKQYALPVQKIMIYIDSHLSSDLSLKAMANMFQINASYLSALFKKETGVTLTEYVNKKRIDHAILLLNSSNAQIQTIAQHCGITDVNYFTKLFKKQVGKTPKEYRALIRK